MRKRTTMAKSYPQSNFQSYRPSRNPYAGKFQELPIVGGHSPGLADHATECHRGQWRNYLGRPEGTHLTLELGAYHGETCLNLAQASPDALFLGVEWKFKVCFKGAKKASAMGLTNLCFLRANIARLPWMIAPGEVDRVMIFFPDPWSKLSQQKWRVLHEGFFRTLGCLLTEGKELLIKTDHPGYAAFIRESLAEAGCFEPMPAPRAAAAWASIPPTPFERIFLRQGLPIHAFPLFRNAKLVVPPEEVKDVLL
ncbi:MAG: hypothetical protein HUU37_01775 [Bdellovibrionales bacterium]|nr:hypothetical protein [Bdellovibrionales bacterium]